MPRSRVATYYHAFGWWAAQFRQSGFKHGWRRRKMLSQMMRKGYFRLTPTERGEQVAKGLQALKQLRVHIVEKQGQPLDPDEFLAVDELE